MACLRSRLVFVVSTLQVGRSLYQNLRAERLLCDVATNSGGHGCINTSLSLDSLDGVVTIALWSKDGIRSPLLRFVLQMLHHITLSCLLQHFRLCSGVSHGGFKAVSIKSSLCHKGFVTCKALFLSSLSLSINCTQTSSKISLPGRIQFADPLCTSRHGQPCCKAEN